MTETVMEGTPLRRLPTSEKVRDVLTAATGWPWELSRVPTQGTPAAPVDPPYGILYPLGRVYSGPWAYPTADSAWAYQATIVGGRGDQLENGDDILREVLLARHGGDWLHSLDADGVKIIGRTVDDFNGADEAPVTPTLLQVAIRFVLYATPADPTA